MPSANTFQTSAPVVRNHKLPALVDCERKKCKLVAYLRERFVNERVDTPLSLQELIVAAIENPAHYPTSEAEKWLASPDGLSEDPRITVDEKGRYAYLPPYALKDRASIAALLEKQYRNGRGGVTLEELRQSIPHAEMNVNSLPNLIDIKHGMGVGVLRSGQTLLTPPHMTGAHFQRIVRGHTYFYDDPTVREEPVDKTFVDLWSPIKVPGEAEVEQFLRDRGIKPAGEVNTGRDSMAAGRSKKGGKRSKASKGKGSSITLNTHVKDELKDYNLD